MPEQVKKLHKVSDVFSEMYGSPEVVPEEVPDSSQRRMREGWLPFLGAGAARLGSGWLSGIMGAVPSFATTPLAAGISGAGEALAQKIESPDPVHKGLVATEATLGAVPFGKLVRSVKGLSGTALAKQATANAARLAGFIESGNVIRRVVQGDDAIPDTLPEMGFDAGTTALGWFLGKRVPKAFKESEVPPSKRLKSPAQGATSPRDKKPNQLVSELETTKNANGLRSMKAAADEVLPTEIVEKLKLIDERPASGRLQHMLSETGEPVTPEAKRLAAYELKVKERQKQDLLSKFRKQRDEEARKAIIEKEKAHTAANDMLAKDKIAAEKAAQVALKERVDAEKAHTMASNMVAKEQKLANAKTAIESAKADMEPGRPSITSVTETVPTPTGKETLRQSFHPKKPKDESLDGAEIDIDPRPSRGPLPVGRGNGQSPVPKTDPEQVAREIFPTRAAAVEAIAGSGKRGSPNRMSKGKWRAVFEKDEPPRTADGSVTPAPKADPSKVEANAAHKAEVQTETAGYAGPERRGAGRVSGDAEDQKYRIQREAEVRKNLEAQQAPAPKVEAASNPGDKTLREHEIAEPKPVRPEAPPPAPVPATPKPAPKKPSGGATAKPVGKAAMTKQEIDAVTREDVKSWTPDELRQAQAKWPKDKRLLTIIGDELNARLKAAEAPQKPVEAPQTLAKGEVAPAPAKPPTEAPKAVPEAPKVDPVQMHPKGAIVHAYGSEGTVLTHGPSGVRVKFTKGRMVQEQGANGYFDVDPKHISTTEVPPAKPKAEAAPVKAVEPAKPTETPAAKGKNVPPTKAKDPIGPAPTKVTVDLAGAKDGKEVKNRVVVELQKYRQAVQKAEDAKGVDEKGKYVYNEPLPKPLTIEVPDGPTYTFRPDLQQIDNALGVLDKGTTVRGVERNVATRINPNEAFGGIVDKAERPTHVNIRTNYGSNFNTDGGSAPSVKLPIGPEPPKPTGGGAKPAKRGAIPAKGSPTVAHPEGGKHVKLRDMDKPTVFGHELDKKTLTPVRKYIDTSKKGDYGADPLPDGKFRMVPSGDVVDAAERARRLNPNAEAPATALDKAPKKPTTADGHSKADLLARHGVDAKASVNDIAIQRQKAADEYFALQEKYKQTKDPADYKASREAGQKFGELNAAVLLAAKEEGITAPALAPYKPSPKTKAPKGKGPTNEDIAKLPPDQQESKLQEIVDTFKKKGARGVKGQKGFAAEELNMLLGQAGLATAGALAGAAMTPDDPLTGALIGAGAGLSPYAVYRVLSKHVSTLPPAASKKSQSALNNYVQNKAKVFADILPDAYRASLLSKPEGLLINSFVGPYGGALMGSLEHAVAGDVRGMKAFAELITFAPFLKTWFSKSTRAEAKLRVAKGDTRADMFGSKGPKALEWAIRQPAEIMTTGDIAARKALMKHGFSEKEARAMTLTSEPYFKGVSDFVRAGEPSQGLTILKRMALPFFRTSQNQVEQSFMRAPVLGLMAESLFKNTPRSLQLKLAQQGIGAGVMGIGYALGAVTPKEQRARYAKLLTNFGGPYGGLIAVGFVAGYKSQTESDVNKQIEAGITGAIKELPLPTGDSLASIAKATIQTGAIPLKMVLEGKLDEQDIPDLPFGFVPPLLSSKEQISIPSAMRDPKNFATERFRPTQKEYSLLVPFVKDPELKDLPRSDSEIAKETKRRELAKSPLNKEKQEKLRQRRKELRNKRRMNELQQ